VHRLTVLRILERVAAGLRRIGLGGLVDRMRGRALQGLGDFTEQVGDVVLSGDIAQHSHYVRMLTEHGREDATARAFTAAVAPGAVVLDIGAHLGYFTAVAAKRGAQVVAFEPNPRTLPYLRRNVQDNGVSERVRIVERAVGAAPGSATFYVSEGGDESSLHAHAADDEPVMVQVARVDDEAGGLRADVIKMDVEGGEIEALKGMTRTIEHAAPELVLFVERNAGALRRAGHAPEDLDALLRALGLRFEVLDEDVDAGYVNLLCRRA
jgi:FkbM family methyltransferase